MLARLRSLTTFPLVVLVVGFGFSAAINIMATWPDPHLVMGGVMASLALPASIHLWPMVPVRAWHQRSLRALVMTAIAGMAAYITFRHGAALMVPPGVDNGWDRTTGYLYTLITEALVVLGVMAHRARQQPPTELGATPAQPHEPTPDLGPSPVEPEPDLPAPAPPRREPLRAVGAPSVRDRVRAEYLATARRVLADGGSLDDIVLAQVDARAGASKGYAKKFAAHWRAELEAEQVAVS